MMSFTLSQILDQYATARPLSPGARYLMRRTIRLFAAFLGSLARVSDLDDQVVSRWLESLEKTHAASTRAGHRVRLLCLWRFAARRGYCPPPGEIRRERAPDPQPEAWTLEQVARLLAACVTLGGQEGEYLGLLVRVCYESGLRRGDVWRLHRDQIAEVVRLRQGKTGYAHEPRLSAETVAAVLRRPGEHPLACPWGTRRYSRAWATVRRLAGLDGGACQQLRRTGATWVAVRDGEDAARRYLGHRSAEMIRFYLDRTIYRPRGVLPPRVA